MRVMKIVGKEMKRKGVTMKRFYDNFPLCCPSRTTILTGQYAHNHNVLSNTAPDGGYGVFNELHGDNYLPLWLQAAGYQTSYVGKFLNGYAEPDEYGTVPTDVPRGWNDWHVLAPSRAQYFGYTLNQNGVADPVHRGRGGLQHRRLHEQGEALHPRATRRTRDPVLPRARLRRAARRRRRRAGQFLQPRRRPGAAPPRRR